MDSTGTSLAVVVARSARSADAVGVAVPVAPTSGVVGGVLSSSFGDDLVWSVSDMLYFENDSPGASVIVACCDMKKWGLPVCSGNGMVQSAE